MGDGTWPHNLIRPKKEKKKKKEENGCVAPKWNFWIFGSVGRKMIIFNYLFKKHPKVQNLGAFSSFFSKKGEKTPDLTKIGCIPDPNF